MAELLGTHSYSLDPKGRVSLPVKFREAFDEGLWLTVGQDRCLYCFPKAEWERRSREVDAFALSDKDGRAFSRLFFASADEVRLDAQGRVTIPQRLRDVVGIKKEVVVLGVRERMEIWDRGEFDRYRRRPRDRLRERRAGARGPQSGGPSDGDVPGRADRTQGPDRKNSQERQNRRRCEMQTKLSTEVRQSLSLLAMTALTLLASIGLGIWAGQIG